MTADPTNFFIENGVLTQQRRLYPYYHKSNTTPAYQIPYDGVFETNIQFKDIEQNWNGAVTVTWVTGTGTIMYSSLNDYKRIIKELKPDILGWYKGLFRFRTRGATNRSLTLAAVKTVAEPNIVDTKTIGGSSISLKTDGYIKFR